MGLVKLVESGKLGGTFEFSRTHWPHPDAWSMVVF